MFGVSTVARTSVLAFLSNQSCMTNTGLKTIQRGFTSGTLPLSATNYLLQYDYIPEVLEKRGPYREGHLNLAKDLIAEGKCLSGGPTGEPNMEVPTGALFVFTDLASAEKFVKEDPYVENGIVTGHTISEWNVVVQKE